MEPAAADARLRQASAAFESAASAAQATAAVLGDTPLDAHMARLTAPDAAPCDAIAAAHRLNERFAACATYDDGMALAGALSTPAVCEALVGLLSEGEALVELAVQLMQNLCLHDDGALAIQRAGALPVLAAALRADEPLLRAQGLALFATLAERPSMAKPLVRAGVVKLLCFLGKSNGFVEHLPALLEIAEAILREPLAVPAAQRQQLRDVLSAAARLHKAAQLPLALHDARRLNRLLIVLRALNQPAQQAAAAKAQAAVAAASIR